MFVFKYVFVCFCRKNLLFDFVKNSLFDININDKIVTML